MSIPAKSSISSFASNHFKDAEGVNSDADSIGTLSDSESETCSVDSTYSTTYEFVRRNGTSSESASSSSSHASGVFVRNPNSTPECPGVQAKLGPIALLNPAPGEPTHINANQIPLGKGQQFLGATVRPGSPTASKELLSLAKAAQAANLANKRDEGRNEPAEIVQFISPRAFFNPGASVDKPISQLIRSYKNGLIEGVGTLTKFEERKNSASSAQAHNPPIRSFTVTYRDAEDVEQTLILTEIAPDFRNSLMTAKSIEDTVAQLDGKFSEGMLSWGGVGRVAIVRVALEVKQAIEKAKPGSVDDKWIQKQVNDAIANLEKYRPEYLSKKLAQRDELIRYLQGVATQHIQSAPKPVESTSEQTEVKQKPLLAKTGVRSAPKSATPSSVKAEVTTKSTFIENAKIAQFKNFGSSCYMNSGLKFLMLTQGEELIPRLEHASTRLERDKEFFTKVSNVLTTKSGQFDESEIEKVIKLVSFDSIAIQQEEYKNKETSKLLQQARCQYLLENTVTSYMGKTPHFERSSDGFERELENHLLVSELEKEVKDKLVDHSDKIYESVAPLLQSVSPLAIALNKELASHVSALNIDCGLENYKEEFASKRREALQAALKGDWSALQGYQPDFLDKVLEQIKDKLKEIDKNIPRLNPLRNFFISFQQSTDPKSFKSAQLEAKLNELRGIFEEVCFRDQDQFRQQDPVELFETCQRAFLGPTFFEHAHCVGEPKNKGNQIQVHYSDLVKPPTTSVDFAMLLTEFEQSDSFDQSVPFDDNELYVTIRYGNEKQFFGSFDLDHRFEANAGAGKQHYQLDTLIMHKGSTTSRGHYLMIQRDGANTWTKHDDSTVSPKLPTQALTDLVPSDTNPCRPVMIRLKKV